MLNTVSTSNQSQPQTKWYDIKKIADAFSVSVNTVRSWQQRKQMPQPDIQQHKFTRWKAENIEPFISDPIKWREENEVPTSTSVK